MVRLIGSTYTKLGELASTYTDTMVQSTKPVFSGSLQLLNIE